ncbi:LTA synthase family protein [Shewanella sp. GXUN23E]|uniref:LTA synthase family protein n=1 Tax=Shewanella sp. GXUN23E TaxID=3422498 RepID=UPI003D7EE75C
MTWYWSRVDAADGIGRVLLQGVRVDIAILCWLWGLAALITLMAGLSSRLAGIWGWGLRLWLVAGLWLLMMLEVTTPSFIDEYGFRPNRLYVEYLIYPKEVLSMLWTSRKGEILLSVLVATLVAVGGWRLAARWVPVSGAALRRWWVAPLILVVAALVVLGGRSSLGHRPLNPAMVAFSTDPLVNSLAVNSAYSLAFAIKQMGSEADAAKVYGALPEAEIIDVARRESGRQTFANAAFPSQSFNQASYSGKPRNLVILLQESLGARFVGTLGGKPLTPNLDALYQQGWAFNNLYATGTRSVRGIEAVLTGFTPTPARSVVKLGKSQTNFFTLASLLRTQGYHTQFVYGGESHFDNMRSFFLGNGFGDIVEEGDYANPVFKGSWGVSDEDLMARAHQEFEALHQQGKPFFSLVFSSSNHEPFEFPDDRIELYEQPKQTRNNAAKYADYAVGEFFRQARNAAYWNDTVFLVVADHDSRVSGADLVPVSRFHIPGVILGGGIDPRQDGRLVSQIDLAPTLLSLMGISGDYPMLGRDLTQMPDDWEGRAMMQYDRNFAYMQGQDLVILQPDREPLGFVLDDSGSLQPKAQPESLSRHALGLVLWGSLAYQNMLYQ